MDGVVVSFDDHRGYGMLRAADGRDIFFHCTRIAGGTREIEVGTPVAFEVVPGRAGRWEAMGVIPSTS